MAGKVGVGPPGVGVRVGAAVPDNVAIEVGVGLPGRGCFAGEK